MIVSDMPGTTRDAIDTTAAVGPNRDRPHRHGGDPSARRGRRRARRGEVLDASVVPGDLPRGRRRPPRRWRRRPDRAGRAHRGLRGRRGQGTRHRGQQVGRGRGEDRQHVRPVRRVDPARGAVPRFRPGRLDLGEDGQRVERVLELAVDVWAERRRRIPTGELNRVVGDATARQEPPMVKGRRPKIFYATQVAVAPPTFVFFAREAALGALQLPALPREPAARRVRLPRDADPARLPRAGDGPRAAARRRSAGPGRARRGGGRRSKPRAVGKGREAPRRPGSGGASDR